MIVIYCFEDLLCLFAIAFSLIALVGHCLVLRWWLFVSWVGDVVCLGWILLVFLGFRFVWV